MSLFRTLRLRLCGVADWMHDYTMSLPTFGAPFIFGGASCFHRRIRHTFIVGTAKKRDWALGKCSEHISDALLRGLSTC